MTAVAVARSLRSINSESLLSAQSASGDFVDVLGGPCAPTNKPLSALRDDIVKGEADALRSGTSKHTQELQAARKILSTVRAFLCRRRYQRHTYFVRLDLDALRTRKERIAILQMQKVTKGFLCRRRFLKLWSLDEERKKEEAAKKASKKGGGKKNQLPPPPPVTDVSAVPLPSSEAVRTYIEASAARNAGFLVILRQLFEEKYDDCILAVEAYVKSLGANVPGDAVIRRLQVVAQRRKNISLGLPPNAAPTAAATPGAGAAAAAKKKK